MTRNEIITAFPGIAKHRPELIDQLASDNGAWDSKPQVAVWLPGKALDYFQSTGGIKANDHQHATPYAGGWAALTNGRWISGGVRH